MKQFLLPEQARADIIDFLMKELPMIKAEGVVQFLRQLQEHKTEEKPKE